MITHLLDLPGRRVSVYDRDQDRLEGLVTALLQGPDGTPYALVLDGNTVCPWPAITCITVTP